MNIKYYKVQNELSFLKVLKGIDVVAAGGWALSEAQLSIGKTSHYNDIDIFCLTQEVFEKACKALQKDHPGTSYDTLYARNIMIGQIKVQVIKPSGATSHDTLIENFDLDNSKYWSRYPFTHICTYQPMKTLHDISISGKMSYFLLARIFKYTQRKNLSIDAIPKEIVNGFLQQSKYDVPMIEYETNARGITQSSIYESVNMDVMDFLMYLFRTSPDVIHEFRKLAYSGDIRLLGMKPLFENICDFIPGNFLFDYWACDISGPETPGFVGGDFRELYTNEDFFNRTKEKVARYYPEALL